MDTLPLEQLGVNMESLQASGIALGILAVLNIPVYWVLFKVLFEDFSEFSQAVIYWFTPDGWSFLRGEWTEDFFAEVKLMAWGGLSALAVGTEFFIFGAPIQSLFN